MKSEVMKDEGILCFSWVDTHLIVRSAGFLLLSRAKTKLLVCEILLQESDGGGQPELRFMYFFVVVFVPF